MKFLKTALVALMISAGAGSALAHTANTFYYVGVNAPSDMPRPTPDNPSPGEGYLWACKTNSKGQWEKTLLGLKQSCDYRLDPSLASTPTQAPASQTISSPDAFTRCNPNSREVYCKLRIGLQPYTAAGQPDSLYKREGCDETTCSWWNTRVEKSGAQFESATMCTDSKRRFPYRGQCWTKKDFKFLVRMENPIVVGEPGISGFYGPGIVVGVNSGYPYYGRYGYQNVSRGYRYHPSKLDAPSVCDARGDYRRSGGHPNC